MGIQVLGPLAVDGSGRLGSRDRAVLLALTVRQGRSVTTDELVDAVWGDRPPASAHKNLQSCVVRLRKALGTDAIETTPDGYRLGLPVQDLDTGRFEAQVSRARELLRLGEADRVVYVLEQALDLWRGPPFTDLSEWGPARREASRLEELRRDAEELLLEAQLARGRARDVLPRAHEMVRSAPLRERRWELLALAQYRTGAQGEALRTIRQLRTVLARELGIDPAPELVALEQSTLRQDASLQHDEDVPLPSSTCPWQGLQAYDVTEADRFFGREAEIEAGLAILARHHLLALVGPSGSGKSSLMRAGIGARLQQRRTRCVTVTPGRYPTRSLTALAALRAGDALLVDQAEELFTLCDDPDETSSFIDRLVDEAVDRPVVVALRADRLADLTAYAAFSRLVERGLYLVGGLDEAGLRAAVEGPARQAGLLLEPGLVDLLVTEVRDDPGALPLLSHALLETWKRREGGTLTVDGYRDSGGIRGAVAQSAEQLYARVEPGHRDALRELVLRLLSPGSEGEPVRTRVPRRLIGTDPEQDRLVEMLVSARLVTSDDGVLEITHESLARAWPRLRGWLEDDVDGRRILHHLSSTADAWDTLGRPPSELYRGVRLTRALDWWKVTGATLTSVERDFLEAARAQAEVEEQTAVERARSQARLIRRLRIVLGGAVVLLVLALLAGGFAAVQSERANENAARAEQAAVAADARRVGTRAQLTDDISLSLLLAAAGARLDDSPETRANLWTALAAHPLLVRSALPEGGFMETLVVSPDGRWVAASDDQNRMHVYDAATNRLEGSYDDAATSATDEQAWMFAAFSPDSSTLAVGLEVSESTEPVRLLDPDTMDETTPLSFPDRERLNVGDLQFSADGHHLAAQVFPPGKTCCPSGASDRTGHVLVWDLRAPHRAPHRVATGVGFQGIALGPDGRTVYTSWPLTAYDVASGTRIWRRPAVTTFFSAPEVDVSGTLLALGETGTRHALLVDARTGRTVTRLRGHREEVGDIRFSPDGSRVGAVSWGDEELIVWDTATGRLLHRWDTTDPYGVGFGPDNDLVHGGGADSLLRTWDVSMQETYLTRTTQVSGETSYQWAQLSPDGQRVGYRWVDARGRGWVRFVATGSGKATPPARLPAWRDWWWIPGAWHPDGLQYVGYCCYYQTSAGRPGTVRVLDAVTGQHVGAERDVIEGEADITSIAYVLGGESMLVGDSEGTTTTFDTDTLRANQAVDVPAHVVTPIGDGSTAMLFETSPVVGGGMQWRLVDLRAGDVTTEGHLDHRAYASVASPDGSTVAAAGETGEIVTIDVSTGAQRRSTSLGVELWSIDWSDDGELLVSGAQDGGVSLWDATSLDLLGTVRAPHDGDPMAAGARFIGDSHDVAIASYDGAIYRWDTDLDRALDFACQMAGRDLTEKEWEQVLPAQPYRSVCPQE